MTKKKRILFICTGNSCRSQMAEAILRHLGNDRFEAFSAGSHPAGFIHPLAIEAMGVLDIPMEGQTSKSWEEFADTPVDVVITLCDAAAIEICPIWPGDAIVVHWSLPDPAYFPGEEEDRIRFAIQIAQRIRAKIEGLIELDWTAERDELIRRLVFLGEI